MRWPLTRPHAAITQGGSHFDTAGKDAEADAKAGADAEDAAADAKADAVAEDDAAEDDAADAATGGEAAHACAVLPQPQFFHLGRRICTPCSPPYKTVIRSFQSATGSYLPSPSTPISTPNTTTHGWGKSKTWLTHTHWVTACFVNQNCRERSL